MSERTIEYAICVKFNDCETEIEFYTRDGFAAAKKFFNELCKSDTIEYIDLREEVIEDGFIIDSVTITTI